MTHRHGICALIGLGLTLEPTGCGLPSSPPITITPPQNPISVLFVVGPPSSLAVSASTSLIAGVVNGADSTVTWSVTCSSPGACGSFGPTVTLSSSPTTYTAPATIPVGGTVTVTATSDVDTSKSVSAKITITPPLPIIVAFLGVPPASLQVNATVTMHAQVTNDVSDNPQVQWSVTCPSAPCGSFNPVTTNNEALTSYTAPPNIPSGNTVTVTATSATDSTKSVSANIVITHAAATLANGTYVFQIAGPIGIGANSGAGVFTAQNGNITGGEQDFVSYAVDQNTQQASPLFDRITGGSYGTTPDGNLQITLNTNDLNVGLNGTETLNGVSISSSRVLLTQVGSYIASGTLELQTGTAAPSGGYAFATYGVDLFGQPAAIGGVLNVDSAGRISGNGSVLDVNDGGTLYGAQTLGASTVSTPDSFGRVVFQLSPRTVASLSSYYLAGYTVNATEIRLVETSGDSFQGIMGGAALGQGANAGNFTAGSIAGSSYVFDAAGEEAGAFLQVAGVFTANSSSTLTGILNWNDLSAKNVQSPILFTGSYAVDPTGRVTLSGLTDGSTFTYRLQLYLDGSGRGLLLSIDSTEVIAGRSFEQQTGPITAGSFSGNYGFLADQIPAANSLPSQNATLGPITAVAGSDTGAGTLMGFIDFGVGVADVGVSGNYAAAGSNGIFTGTMRGLEASAPETVNNFAFYVVDNTRIAVIETDNAQLSLGWLEFQQ